MSQARRSGPPAVLNEPQRAWVPGCAAEASCSIHGQHMLPRPVLPSILPSTQDRRTPRPACVSLEISTQQPRAGEVPGRYQAPQTLLVSCMFPSAAIVAKSHSICKT